MEVVRLPRRPAGRGGQQRSAVAPERAQQRRQGAAAGGVQRQQRAGRRAAPLEEVLRSGRGVAFLPTGRQGTAASACQLAGTVTGCAPDLIMTVSIGMAWRG